MALASYKSPPKPPTRRTTRSNRRRSRPSSPQKPSPTLIYTLPKAKPKPIPPKLQFLLTCQQGFSWLTFVLVVATLATYSWTVYAPKLWSREYRKLETLQRQERHLSVTNEGMKKEYADQAETPKSGLKRANPTDNIFIPAKDIPNRDYNPKNDTPESLDLTNAPIAY